MISPSFIAISNQSRGAAMPVKFENLQLAFDS
jgi:hypothetical protein